MQVKEDLQKEHAQVLEALGAELKAAQINKRVVICRTTRTSHEQRVSHPPSATVFNLLK